MILINYSQTCVQLPPLGPEKCGCYAKGCLKNISGKKALGWSLFGGGRWGMLDCTFKNVKIIAISFR